MTVNCSTLNRILPQMGTAKPEISKKDRNSILNQIINCANCALQNDDAFQKAMLGLARELRAVFDSEYCSIGIVDDGHAEECVISYRKIEDEELSKQQEIVLNSVKRVSIHSEDKYIVYQALKSDRDIFLYEEKTGNIINNEYYQSILASGHLNNLYVIPLRDKEKKNFGFIQFINTKRTIDYDLDFSPYNDALLGLVQIIINNKKNHQELIKRENRLKDTDFYNMMQDKRDNVDELLDSIMKYFSNEFNAAIVSFRIPLLNGYNKELLFYLRDFFVHPSIGDSQSANLKNHYYSKRLVIKKDDIYGVDQLRCGNEKRLFESKSETDFSQFGLDLDSDTLIIPIFRDFYGKCNHKSISNNHFCYYSEHLKCKERFKRLYGIFRLRISRTALSKKDETYLIDLEETMVRLDYLSKQITLLLNSIVDKNENESLKVFQDELKNSSFIKIKDFDECCVEIIKKAVHAKVCSIYRYNNQTRLLTLSATTAERIRFNINQMLMHFPVAQVQNSCFINSKATNNILAKAYNNNPHSLYVFNIYDSQVHQSPFIERVEDTDYLESALAVPMIKKDGSCAGVVLLLGKEEHKHSISTSYWEHDISHIEFIVNMLTRISESDTERLTFLSQLSHELLAPVTELVYDNDLTVNTAERNIDSFSKRQLVAKIRENIDRNLLFKYIINDTEFIYSSTGRSIDYNIVKQEKPQAILLNAIRLLEKQAHANSLIFITYIKEMPPLYFDKERMMQVFLNILKNAIRYSFSQSTISISYKKGINGFHEICFRNEGIGVKKEETESIFELFNRGDAARRKFTRGTGMGLYIVRNIMRAHGGDCFVGRLQNPTEFVITLPNKE